MTRMLLVVLGFTLVLGPVSAQAAPILTDNFDSEANGLNYTTFVNFTVSDGTVDMIGAPPPFFDLIPGNGHYVDLDGSSANAGILTANPLALGPGSYTLSFDLAGSHRGDSNTVTIIVFGNLNPAYASMVATKLSADPFSSNLLSFTLLAADSVRFSFSNAGGDNLGALLDRVELNDGSVAAVPEPTSLLLLGTGGLGLIAMARRRKKQQAKE